MKRSLILAATAVLALPAPSLAQAWPPHVAPYARPYPGGTAAAIADQHRYENERLRAQAQANAAFAARQRTETQLRRLEIEAARAPVYTPTAAPRPLYSPEQERALGASAAERRARSSAGVGQIDDWLDRAPR